MVDLFALLYVRERNYNSNLNLYPMVIRGMQIFKFTFNGY